MKHHPGLLEEDLDAYVTQIRVRSADLGHLNPLNFVLYKMASGSVLIAHEAELGEEGAADICSRVRDSRTEHHVPDFGTDAEP